MINSTPQKITIKNIVKVWNKMKVKISNKIKIIFNLQFIGKRSIQYLCVAIVFKSVFYINDITCATHI